jgi:hypothetical protein
VIVKQKWGKISIKNILIEGQEHAKWKKGGRPKDEKKGMKQYAPIWAHRRV